MRLRFRCLVSCAGLLFSTLCTANNYVSLQWDQTQTLEDINSRRIEYQPQAWGVAYQRQLTNYSWGLTVWLGESEEALSGTNAQFEEQTKGASLYIGRTLNGWGFNTNISYGVTEQMIRSDAFPDLYSEDLDNLNLSLSIDYLVSSSGLDWMPSFGLGWQQLESDIAYHPPLTPMLTITSNDTQKNLYAFAGLSSSYWWDYAAYIVISPGLQFGWTEYLDGDGEQEERASLRTDRRGTLNRSNKQGYSANNDGSGFLSGSLSFLIQDLSISYSLSRTINLDENVTSHAVEVGLHF